MSLPEGPLTGQAVPPSELPQAPLARPSEGSSWGALDVFLMVVLMVTAFLIFMLVITFAVQHFLYPKLAWTEVWQFPLVTVAAQFLAYAVVLAFMFSVVARDRAHSFWREIGWNFPKNWTGYLFGGVLLSVGLQVLARYLPMPKDVPMDRFFQTALEAWVLSIFGATVGPLMEELFFRGFLYPVLARKLGTAISVLITSLAFSIIHGPQLGRAWGPVLVIFVVGLVLTLARAITRSVAAGLLLHASYNATIFFLMLFATDGFRHLERLNQQ